MKTPRVSGACDCHCANYSDFPDSFWFWTGIIHRVINLCSSPMARCRTPSLAEPSSRKYVRLHFLEVSAFSPEGSAGRPAMMMRMTTRICYIIQWQGGGGCAFGGLCRAELRPADSCVTISALSDGAASKEKNSLFSVLFFDLCVQQSGERASVHFRSRSRQICNHIIIINP